MTAVGDLRRWRQDIPDSVAITAGCADSGTRHITYREYAHYVERLAGADFELSAALADIATRLPHLRHRVVLGEHVRAGEVGIALHFEHMPWEKRHSINLDNPCPAGEAAIREILRAAWAGAPVVASS